MTEIWAHARAESISIPNRLASFAASFADGADGLELDVHRTADGKLVCAHDETLLDSAGQKWNIGDLTYAELERYVDPRADDADPLPLLDEVYVLLRPTSMKLNIEAKNLLRPYPGMAESLRDSIIRSGMQERVVVSSFHHRLLRELTELDSSVATAALYSDGLLAPWEYLRSIGVRQVHPHFSSLREPGVIEGFRRSGIDVRAWTVNDPALWDTFVAAELDAIITDLPITAREHISTNDR